MTQSANLSLDVLIIGSGAAGLSLALRLPASVRTGLVAKRELEEGNTLYAQGGISAVLDARDSVDSHVEDTLNAGAGLCDEEDRPPGGRTGSGQHSLAVRRRG